MKLINSVFLFCSLLLSQTLLVSAVICPLEYNIKSIYFKKPEDWGNIIYSYIYSKNGNDHYQPKWPGDIMKKHGDYYQTYFPLEHFVDSDYKVIFSDGKHQIPGVMEEGFDFVVDGVYNQNGIIGINSEEIRNSVSDIKNIAKIYYRPKNLEPGKKNKNIYIHYALDNGKWNSVPGEKMVYNRCKRFYYIAIDLKDSENITFCFDDEDGNWDNNYGEDYKFKKFSNMIIDRSDRENY